MDAFHRVCETVAYAHSNGVVHRDLKPDNVMVGSFGEVFVLDWGLAKVLEDDPTLEVDTDGQDFDDYLSSASDEFQTRVDAVIGTPQYMSPEQARGEIRRVERPSDVYSLGATLYEILAGHPPIIGNDPHTILQAARDGEIVPYHPPGPVPPELEVILARAMALEPEDRYPDAGALAMDLADWLQGTRQQEEALKLVSEADAIRPQLRELKAAVAERRAQALKLLESVKPHEPVENKKPAWNLEAEAARLDREANLKELSLVQLLHSALNLAPSLPEAHERLADHYSEALLEAESRRDEANALRAEVLLRTHDRGRYQPLLKGLGTLRLVTDPPGARVHIFRYSEEDRRMVARSEIELGPTPLEVELPRGSYLAMLRAEGRTEVRYPFHLERGGRWEGIAPGDSAPVPIQLPESNELSPDEVYVPAGWFVGGGDPDALDPLPRGRWWIDAFITRRFPVTNAEYVSFLNDLVARGDEAEALARAPQTQETQLLRRDEKGFFLLGEDRRGQPWLPEQPVYLVSWLDACAYARWFARHTGKSWRLPHELEREKAGRGVDGRLYPWGDFFDPTWAAVLTSHSGPPCRFSVHSFPSDESPYGVRATSGGVSDWCANAYRRAGAAPPESRVSTCMQEEDIPQGEFQAVRGGAWMLSEPYSRLAGRLAGKPGMRYASVGFRLVRSY